MKTNYSKKILEEIASYGNKILEYDNMQKTKQFVQHGKVSCYSHCVSVAYVSMLILEKMRIKYDKESLIRGALLHDYFLYDWHVVDPHHHYHGFSHAKTALNNARRDFEINKIEADIISKHMFPLNIRPPHYKESFAVCIADKICAVHEIIHNAVIPKSAQKAPAN